MRLQVTLLERSLSLRKEQVEELLKLTKPQTTNRALWFALGAALGVAAVVGIVYAVVPARPTVITAPTALGVRF